MANSNNTKSLSKDYLLEVEEAAKTIAETVTGKTTESADQENVDEETTEIKLETAPGDYQFPTTNQSGHSFARYVKFHRCVAAKGEGASECDKFEYYWSQANG